MCRRSMGEHQVGSLAQLHVLAQIKFTGARMSSSEMTRLTHVIILIQVSHPSDVINSVHLLELPFGETRRLFSGTTKECDSRWVSASWIRCPPLQLWQDLYAYLHPAKRRP